MMVPMADSGIFFILVEYNLMQEATNQQRWIRISVGIYLLSLVFPCYSTGSTNSQSIMALTMGWIGMLSGGAAICWLANPLLWTAWILFTRKPRVAMFFSMGAFLMAFFFLLFTEVVANENNQTQRITERKLGYWLWLGSTFVMLVGSYAAVYRLNVKRFREREANENKNRFLH